MMAADVLVLGQALSETLPRPYRRFMRTTSARSPTIYVCPSFPVDVLAARRALQPRRPFPERRSRLER